MPEPKNDKAARERVEEARDHIAKATAIITHLQDELGSQTQQLDAVLKELEEKKQLAEQYGALAKTGQDQFSAFKNEMESALRQELTAQSEKGKGVRRVASAILWAVTLILGAYLKDVIAWLR